MKRNQSIVFGAGALFALIGAVSYITGWVASPYIYSVGAVMVASVQLFIPFKSTNIVMKRLRRQQMLGAIFLVLTGLFMFTNRRGNEWIVCLTIASLLELYTAFRMPIVEKNS